jgi:hypothetical protein
MYVAFHSLKDTDKCFVVPAILLFWGETVVPTADDSTLYALLLKAGCWSFSALFYLCRGTELVTFK